MLLFPYILIISTQIFKILTILPRFNPFKMNMQNRFLNTKSSFELVCSCCEFTKVILWSKSWCEMFILKFSGIQIFLSKYHFDKLLDSILKYDVTYT